MLTSCRSRTVETRITTIECMLVDDEVQLLNVPEEKCSRASNEEQETDVSALVDDDVVVAEIFPRGRQDLCRRLACARSPVP